MHILQNIYLLQFMGTRDNVEIQTFQETYIGAY